MATTIRMDMHCHSRASGVPSAPALRLFNIPECFSPPEQVYDLAKARGMDLFTLTDHDTIAGALELLERGFPDLVVGEEVTVCFPEDRCRLHVLVWELTPALHEEIGALDLRRDVYEFAHWLHARNLPHALAHPLYAQNGKLTRWHLERCALLFKGWEVINGAHTGRHRATLEAFLASLTPASIQQLARRHERQALWTRPWHKSLTAGSDDHALLNIGRAWTQVHFDADEPQPTHAEFFRRIMAGHARVGGQAGDPTILAHQLTAVGAHLAARNLNKPNAPITAPLSSLARLSGVGINKPSRWTAAWRTITRRILPGPRHPMAPLLEALHTEFETVLARHPEVRNSLGSSGPADGPPLSNHTSAAAFADELSESLARLLTTGTAAALRRKDTAASLDHLTSIILLACTQLPSVFSLFHQNKERALINKLRGLYELPHATSRSRSVLLFTDTLADINGVSRFVRDMAACAVASGRDLTIITSTTKPCPSAPNIINLPPLFSGPMPGYPQLDLVLPPIVRMLRLADESQPDAIHVSTPGPVGIVGAMAAKMLRVPLIGTHHTDFPAYIDSLFDDASLTSAAGACLKFFYGQFNRVLARSHCYAEMVEQSGIVPGRIIALTPGIDTDTFHPAKRESKPGLWATFEARSGKPARGLSRPGIKVLYVGRISVEKNLPLLADAWTSVWKRCTQQGLAADLIIVGDGPYRPEMSRRLCGKAAHFLGFQSGDTLAAIYASSDLFVFPSTTDTLGQAVMEAQASGLPVIVSDHGGPREIIRDGETGVVVPAANHEAWASTILELILGNERRATMSIAARGAIEHRTIETSFEHFWSIHEDAIAESLAPSHPDAVAPPHPQIGIIPQAPHQPHPEPRFAPRR